MDSLRPRRTLPAPICSHRLAEKTGRREAPVSPLPTAEAEQGSSRLKLAVESERQVPEGASGLPQQGEHAQAPSLPRSLTSLAPSFPGRTLYPPPTRSFTKCLETTPHVASREPHPLDAVQSPEHKAGAGSGP